MALGPNGSFVFSYRANTGKVRISKLIYPILSPVWPLECPWPCAASMNIPEGLKTWLYTKDAAGKLVRNFENLSVSLGPDGKAFWAMDGKNFIWNSLPNDLSIGVAGLLKNGTFTDSPRLVTLGVGGDYFMLTKNDACYWRLTNYRELNAVMPTFQNNKAFHTIRVRPSALSSTFSLALTCPSTESRSKPACGSGMRRRTQQWHFLCRRYASDSTSRDASDGEGYQVRHGDSPTSTRAAEDRGK